MDNVFLKKITIYPACAHDYFISGIDKILKFCIYVYYVCFFKLNWNLRNWIKACDILDIQTLKIASSIFWFHFKKLRISENHDG